MLNINAKFEESIVKELKNNNLAIFAGAGLSRSSGYVDWAELLSGIASDLGLTIDEKTDLVSLAQYYCNDYGRQGINEAIIDKFGKEAGENKNLNILAKLPISVYWTTNYDSLIEDTLSANKKNVDKKINQNQLKNYTPNRDVILYKMHGDKADPDDAVITRDDYESYNKKRPLFITNLKGQLIEKTFLFIGFSFEDPNLEQILSRIRVDLITASPKIHYCFFKKINKEKYLISEGKYDKDKYNEDKIKQELRVKDLRRYGIHTIFVEEYDDITRILERIYLKYKLCNIFVSGSAEEYGTFEKSDAEEFMHKLSKRLIQKEYNIISGFGLGVGSFIINGVLDEVYSKGNYIDDRLIMRPFPQKSSGGKILKDLWTDYRKEMISLAGISIFIFGNKKDSNGDIIDANGMIEEFNIAKEQNTFIIPIATTGYSSKAIMDEIKNDLDKYWYLRDSINILENEKNSEKIIDEVIKIINKIRNEL
ncbi:SIR2 family protein [Clostridium beijerinckii]|uniref:SIR2 family protein n=1 Tax=Clostridium beijerinckii TaxID=1520 RepID=UPI00242EA000|nr:SIR2 family protein [Clostridium beijerinckii]MDG5854921.1 SIR2 family protein [Clostridium beijerinckii]